MKRKKSLFECVGGNQFRITQESNDDMDSETSAAQDYRGNYEWVENFIDLVSDSYQRMKAGDQQAGQEFYEKCIEFDTQVHRAFDRQNDVWDEIMKHPQGNEMANAYLSMSSGDSTPENFGTWGGLG